MWGLSQSSVSISKEGGLGSLVSPRTFSSHSIIFVLSQPQTISIFETNIHLISFHPAPQHSFIQPTNKRGPVSLAGCQPEKGIGGPHLKEVVRYEFRRGTVRPSRGAGHHGRLPGRSYMSSCDPELFSMAGTGRGGVSGSAPGV